MENNGRQLRSIERNEPSTSSENRFYRLPSAPINNNRDTANFMSSQGELLVTLEKPRPRNIRDSNDYCDVHRRTTTPIDSRQSINQNAGGRRSESVLLSALNLNSNSNSDSKITSSRRRSASVEGDRFYNVKEDSWKRTPTTITDKCGTSNVGVIRSLRSGANSNKIVSSASLPTTSSTLIITSQPKSSNNYNSPRQKTAPSSNICPRCNKCRCVDCTTPKTLPSRWICGKTCLLSADNVVDCMSCVCCVDACLYHVTGRRRSDNSGDDADSCASANFATNIGSKGTTTPTCCLRWAIVGTAAAFLSPCLLCYFPLKACGKCAEWTYARRHDYGCRCTTVVVAAVENSYGKTTGHNSRGPQSL